MTRIGAIMIKEGDHIPALVGEKVFRFMIEDGRPVLAMFVRVEDVPGRRSWTDQRFERVS